MAQHFSLFFSLPVAAHTAILWRRTPQSLNTRELVYRRRPYYWPEEKEVDMGRETSCGAVGALPGEEGEKEKY